MIKKLFLFIIILFIGYLVLLFNNQTLADKISMTLGFSDFNTKAIEVLDALNENPNINISGTGNIIDISKGYLDLTKEKIDNVREVLFGVEDTYKEIKDGYDEIKEGYNEIKKSYDDIRDTIDANSGAINDVKNLINKIPSNN